MTQHGLTTTKSSGSTPSKTTQLEKNFRIRALESETKKMKQKNKLKSMMKNNSLTNHCDWANNEAKETHPDNNSSIEGHLAQNDTIQTKKN